MFTIVVFFLVLSLLVLVHELGHFLTARKFGARAEEFGFGLPPRMIGVYKDTKGNWKKVIGSKEVTDAEETVYSLNWLPIGGFVKIKGEDGESEDEDSFASKKIWQKSVILGAGVTMNIILAFVLISIGFMIGFPQAIDGTDKNVNIEDHQIQVIEFLEGSQAEIAGFQVGDIIKGIDNNNFENFNQLQEYVDHNIDKEITYNVRRAYDSYDLKVVPEIREETGRGGVGISVVEIGTVKYPFHLAIWEGLKYTIFVTGMIIMAFFNLLRDLIMGNGISVEVAGPVGIAAITGQAARLGIAHLLQFTALLSINLAIINALPFPALDGGRLLFLGIEKIKGSPVKREIEGMIHYIGLLVLILLILLVTFKDISQYSGVFKNLWSKIIG